MDEVIFWFVVAGPVLRAGARCATTQCTGPARGWRRVLRRGESRLATRSRWLLGPRRRQL